MNYKHLGKSGLKVSYMCLGTNNFGGQVNEQDSIKIITKAIDLGINLIDTANVYTNGRSEEIIGKAVQSYRDDVIIATKVGQCVTSPRPNQGGLSRKHILRQIQKSLIRLNTDFIDIYYLHCFDPVTPLEETLRTLNTLISGGKVRYIACSNFSAWQLAEAHTICEQCELEKFIAVQPRYNLLQRDIEKNLLPYCQRQEIGVLTYSPLMGGFLTGKYAENTPLPTASRAKYSRTYWERTNKDEYFTSIQKLEHIAETVGLSPATLAIAWILGNPLITAPIIGASKLEQIEENCRIAEISIPNQVYEQLDVIVRPA